MQSDGFWKDTRLARMERDDLNVVRRNIANVPGGGFYAGAIADAPSFAPLPGL